MELGILTLSDLQTSLDTGKPVTAAQRVADTIGYGMLADQLGIDLFAVGEHHSLEYAVASPAVVLAAIAARTRTIRLTSAVTVLSALDPVRVYQDFAQLDLVSNGRAEIIAGRSAFVEPFALFGHRVEDYDALYSEKLDLLLRLREQRQVTWSGHFRTALHGAEIAPRAVQNPLPLWVGVGGSPASAERAGRLGLPMILGYIGGPLSHARRSVDLYRAAGEQAGHPDKLRVGISTHFYAGADPRSARDVYPYYREYLRPKKPGGRGFDVNRAAFEAGTQRGQAIMVGSSDELVEKILDACQLLGIDRFYAQFDWGGMPRPMVEDSVHRYATEIAPAVRATDA
ncbi:LLM class flavin-dependent oxidoreductase [Micromonospora musae]|uniref:LLM class flavin-dependent oxidoreductase n=1 Tax=Micromonospora musae TaxID=1894970 RepID=UPI0033C9F7A7